MKKIIYNPKSYSISVLNTNWNIAFYVVSFMLFGWSNWFSILKDENECFFDDFMIVTFILFLLHSISYLISISIVGFTHSIQVYDSFVFLKNERKTFEELTLYKLRHNVYSLSGIIFSKSENQEVFELLASKITIETEKSDKNLTTNLNLFGKCMFLGMTFLINSYFHIGCIF